ncbi:hypothetical protein [Sphingomonas sp. 3-13AW]|uniref:hypothetical protein n=1 Tax=Sphingomonas sp. 3-13AW TaxID=3050450 RepID=UPI003BB8113D
MTQQLSPQDETTMEDAPQGHDDKGPSIYEIVEVGILGVAFAVIYAFGILRFSQMVATEWGRAPAVVFAVFAVVIAIAFIDAISRILNVHRKSEDDHTA